MGCCGRGATTTPTRSESFSKTTAAVIAVDGTILLEYTGTRSPGEAFTIYGFITGTPYRVVPGKIFRADNQDLSDPTKKRRGILDYLEGNKYVFRIVPTPVPVPAPAMVVQDFAEPALMEVEESVLPDFSILDQSVPGVIGTIETGEYGVPELTALLAYELDHKNRKSMIEYLETTLAALRT